MRRCDSVEKSNREHILPIALHRSIKWYRFLRKMKTRTNLGFESIESYSIIKSLHIPSPLRILSDTAKNPFAIYAKAPSHKSHTTEWFTASRTTQRVCAHHQMNISSTTCDPTAISEPCAAAVYLYIVKFTYT